MLLLGANHFLGGCFAHRFGQTLSGQTVTSGQQPIIYCLPSQIHLDAFSWLFIVSNATITFIENPRWWAKGHKHQQNCIHFFFCFDEKHHWFCSECNSLCRLCMCSFYILKWIYMWTNFIDIACIWVSGRFLFTSYMSSNALHNSFISIIIFFSTSLRHFAGARKISCTLKITETKTIESTAGKLLTACI